MLWQTKVALNLCRRWICFLDESWVTDPQHCPPDSRHARAAWMRAPAFSPSAVTIPPAFVILPRKAGWGREEKRREGGIGNWNRAFSTRVRNPAYYIRREREGGLGAPGRVPNSPFRRVWWRQVQQDQNGAGTKVKLPEPCFINEVVIYHLK